MSRLRADLWCAAFVRRYNDLGSMCVIARRGDPVAGQIWIEVDHLNGLVSLFTPALKFDADDQNERWFEKRFENVSPNIAKDRIDREVEFDPDFWLIALEMRDDDPGINMVAKGA